jgi:nicotinamidase/pyrazinamidase
MTLTIRESALLEIDVQNDFCPGGALAIAGGDEVIAPLNNLAARFAREGGRVAATADWHPPGHISFASAHPEGIDPDSGQVLWPDHCVQGSHGAAFHDALDMKPVNLILRKGFRQNLDSYSAFFENDRKTPTGLDGFLRGLGITTVLLGGLATDYCVLYSALDAARLGYQTLVLQDAIRSVGIPEGSEERALGYLEKAGVQLINSGDIV